MGANHSNGEDLVPGGGTGSYHGNKGHYSYGGGPNVKKNKAKPTPPMKVKITDVSHNSISLSWLPPRHVDGNNVIAYMVEMLAFTAGGDRQWKLLTKSCQGVSYDARHLEPNTDYIFRVRAENIYGVGKPSPPSEVATTNMFERPSGKDLAIGLHGNSSTNSDKSGPTLKRRHSFNLHLEGGVSSILHHSDIVLSSKAKLSNSATAENPDTSQLIQRNTIFRTSLQSKRKVPAPILLPGTGTNSIHRLRESRNSLRGSTPDTQRAASPKDFTKNRLRDSKRGISSSSSDTSISGNSIKGSKKYLEASKNSLLSDDSDTTLSCSKENGSENSLCISNSGSDHLDGTILDTDNKVNNKLNVEENNNINNRDNTMHKHIHNYRNESKEDEDDIYKLKEELKNLELSEENEKFCGNLQEEMFAESQRGYYESLDNPWEKDNSVDKMSQRIMAAPVCDDVKMALYAKNLPPPEQTSGYCATVFTPGEAGDFRTLRSVLQSTNMIVKTARSLPDMVGLVMGESGEARMLTRGKLTTILDADEEEDAVRVTTL